MLNQRQKITVAMQVVLIIVLIVLGFGVYLNSVNGGFIWDEEFLIKNNLHIKSWENIGIIFGESIGAGAKNNSNFYRPLQMLTYMADYSLWHLNAFGYHLTGIILHILVALVLYWLIKMLFANWALSLLTSALFLVHPIQTETVAYIAARADLLGALFILLCLCLYIRQDSSRNKITFTLILLSYILALLSKEYSLVLPLLIIMHSYIFKKKILKAEFVSVLGITFIYIILRLTLLRFSLPEQDFMHTTTFLQRIPGFFVALTEYYRLLLFPLNLHMEYMFRKFSMVDPRAILGAIALAVLLVYAFKRGEKNKLVSFCILWFFVTLLPQSNLYPVNAYMSEHWLYLPSIGYFLALAYGLLMMHSVKKFRRLAVYLIALILFLYSFLTVKQNYYWKNAIGFWKKTLQYAPSNPRIYNNLCKAYMDIGEYEEAISSCKKAVALKPGYLTARYNLADSYKACGQYENAAVEYKRIIEHNPRQEVAYFELGLLYEKSGDKEKAMDSYHKAIEIDHSYVEAYNNLASIYAEKGQTDKAIGLWEKTVGIRPDFATGHFNLAVFYFRQKKYDLAIYHCDKVIDSGNQVDPEFLGLLGPYRKKNVNRP
jgi:tetratricopeptide (TPR) repeat protein